MADQLIAEERHKYQRMWQLESYRERSPAMRLLEDALEWLKPEPEATLLDLGCGTGRAAAELQRRGFQVTAVDIANNACREFTGRFVEACLWNLPVELERHRYGFCADVMEHIPTDRVPLTLENIARHADTVYFQIANFHCHEGDQIGEHLHLTVKDMNWWVGAMDAEFHILRIAAYRKHHIIVCKSRVF